jgi:hypothetical protein
MTDTEIDWRLSDKRHSIQRYRPVFMMFQIGLLIVGSLFWINAKTYDQGFSAEIYGTFALQFPAEMWAAIMMAGSAITWLGLIKPIRHKTIITGSLINALQFAALSYSAAFTGGEFVIAVFASIIFMTPHIWLAVEAMLD